MALKFTETQDGSHTLYHEELDETYHSRHGAIREAYHVFIRSGFDLFQNQQHISILEMGFGTGLNCFITYLESLKAKQQIQYTGIEKFPIQPDVWGKLNYLDALNAKEHESDFIQMHQLPWNQQTSIDPNFSLLKVDQDLGKFSTNQKFDLVYFDAFGPRVQPELWEKEVFKSMYMLLNQNGVLVTYSCKGDVRRAMLSAGFEVEKIAGPPGKREMLRAFKR